MEKSKWKKACAIWVNAFLSPTTLLFFLMAADSALLGPNLTLIAQEFEFDDTTRDTLLGGRMNLVFYACGMPAALIAAVLSDSCFKYRGNIVIGAASVAAIATLLVWFLPIGPKAYQKLLFLRGICGAAIGCASAIGTAIMTDMCENSLLAMSSSTGGVVSALGVAAGQAVAGYNGPSKGWRYPFLLFGVIGLATSLSTFLCSCTEKTPTNDEAEAELKSNDDDDENFTPRAPKKKFSSFSLAAGAVIPSCCNMLCCTPTIMLLLSASVIVGMPNSVLDTYWTDYYALLFFTERTAKTDYKFDAKWDIAVELATDITVGVQIGRAVGQVLGGVVGLMFMWNNDSNTATKVDNKKQDNTKLGGFNVLWVCTFIISAYLCLPVPFLYTMLYAPVGKKNYWTSYWLTNFCGGVLNGFNEPLSKAMLLALAPSGLSGVVASLSTMATLLGRAVGPTWVAAIAYNSGRLVAFFDSFVAWFVAAVLLLGMCCSSTSDYRRAAAVEERVRHVTADREVGNLNKGEVRAAAAATRAADKRKRSEKLAEARKLERVKGGDGRGDFQSLEKEDLDEEMGR